MKWNIQIASKDTRKLFVIFTTSASNFVVFEVMSYMLGINAVGGFLIVAVVLYLYLKVKFTFIFDLNLKTAKSWFRSSEFYRSRSSGILTWLLVAWKAFNLRFHYLYHWKQWRHFQNYLILPGLLYWGIIAMMFLNPFDFWAKQMVIVVGTILLAVVLWFLKMVFTDYSKASMRLRYLMFTTTILTAFVVYSTALGLTWYYGIEREFFVLFTGVASFLLFYQSLFHEALVTRKTISLVLIGALILGLGGYFVIAYWSVNFYSAGLVLAGLAYSYWGIVRLYLQKTLRWRNALEYVMVFFVILFFVLATTNFGARIG